MAVKYTYTGKGDALIGVPTRDLTEQDLTERAELFTELGITEELLVSSGLYAPVDTKKKQPRKGGAYLEAAKESE